MGPLIIIFGTRGVTYSAGEGQFHCPGCGVQPYKLKRVRRFFTLYFIPLIPLDLVGEYVECANCKDTYKPVVLTYDPKKGSLHVEAEFRSAMLRTMALMCLADGVIADGEVATISEIYGRLAGQEVTESAVYGAIQQAQRESQDVSLYLSGIAGSLNDQGKEMVLTAAFHVAAADGEFQEQERTLLFEIGKALLMTPSHFRGVIDSLLSSPELMVPPPPGSPHGSDG